MDLKYIFALVCALISFIAGFSGYMLFYKKTAPVALLSWRTKYGFLPFYAGVLVFFPLLYLLFPSREDFISSVNFGNILIPLLCLGAIYGLPFLPRFAKFGEIITAAAVILCTFLLPEDFLFLNGLAPFWLDRILIIVFWTIFSSFYYILNGIDGIISIQTVTIGAGLSLLALFGGTPFLFGLISLTFTMFAVALMIFNWYPAKLTLNKNSCRALGFLCAWLLLLNGGEGNISCGIIFAIYYLVELCEAVIKKLSLREQYANLTHNTNYYQANISGLSPHNIAVFLLKLLVVLVILGNFQLYAPNAFSIPILSFVVSAWFLTRLRDWQNPTPTIKELNKNLVEDIKQNIEDIKNLGKD